MTKEVGYFIEQFKKMNKEQLSYMLLGAIKKLQTISEVCSTEQANDDKIRIIKEII